jgi:hypothetical protein
MIGSIIKMKLIFFSMPNAIEAPRNPIIVCLLSIYLVYRIYCVLALGGYRAFVERSINIIIGQKTTLWEVEISHSLFHNRVVGSITWTAFFLFFYGVVIFSVYKVEQEYDSVLFYTLASFSAIMFCLVLVLAILSSRMKEWSYKEAINKSEVSTIIIEDDVNSQA